MTTGLVFNERQHSYHLNGVRLPGVTTIIGASDDKSGLLKWYGDNGWAKANKMRDAAAVLGTRIHAAIERFNIAIGAEEPYDLYTLEPDLLPYVEGYAQWFNANVREVVAVEQMVWSEHGYAGTLDAALVLMDDPAPVLVDLKSSKFNPQYPNPRPIWRLQSSAYQVALLERTGIACTRRAVVQVPSNDPGTVKFHEFERSSNRPDWEGFLAALKLYQWNASLARSTPGQGGTP